MIMLSNMDVVLYQLLQFTFAQMLPITPIQKYLDKILNKLLPLPRRLCFRVSWFVRLFVNKITQKLLDGFS